MALNARQTEDNDQKSGPCLSFLVVSFDVSFIPCHWFILAGLVYKKVCTLE